MERTPRGVEGPPTEAEQPFETGLGRDLTDADFIDEFNEQEGFFLVEYDSVQAPPSLAVVTVVSIIIGMDPLELDPLYESIEPDALDSLFTADSSSVSRLTFKYNDCEITVGNDDVIEVVAG